MPPAPATPSVADDLRSRLVMPRPSRVLLALAVATALAELAWLATGWTLTRGPTMYVLPAAPLSVVLLVVARRTVDRPHRRDWAAARAALVVVLAVLAVVGAAQVGWAATLELALASASEEVVYRVALPLAAMAALAALGVDRRSALLVGLVASAAVFTVLPGHLAQVPTGGSLVLVAFPALAVLFSYLMWQAGAFVEIAAAHAAINLALLPVEAGVWPPQLRAVTLAVVLLSALYGCHRTQLRRAAHASGEQAVSSTLQAPTRSPLTVEHP